MNLRPSGYEDARCSLLALVGGGIALLYRGFVLVTLAGLAQLGQPVATGMATPEPPTARRTHDAKNDDLRDLLAMLAQVVGARVQRDVDGRDDQDAEADAVLAKMRETLRALLVAREQAQPKAFILGLVEELAASYRTAPSSAEPEQTSHAPGSEERRAAWVAYRARVGKALGGIAGANAAKVARWCLTHDQIVRPRRCAPPKPHAGGPLEAARAAVADVTGTSARTLAYWQGRDGVKANIDSAFAPRGALVYGDAVEHAQAIADVVELLAIADLHPEADPSAYVAALRSACAPDISRLVDDGVDVE